MSSYSFTSLLSREERIIPIEKALSLSDNALPLIITKSPASYLGIICDRCYVKDYTPTKPLLPVSVGNSLARIGVRPANKVKLVACSAPGEFCLSAFDKK